MRVRPPEMTANIAIEQATADNSHGVNPRESRAMDAGLRSRSSPPTGFE